jgi:hypothetical protein
MLNYLDELYAKSKNDVNKDNDITNAESDDDDQENVVEGIPHWRHPDLDDESDEEVQKKPSIKDKLFSYISNLGSYTDFMSGFSDTFGFQEEVYEVNNKEFDKCDVNVPPNSKIVGIFDNQCVWLDDNNEIKTTDYNKNTLLNENKNTTNTNEGNAENELSDEVIDLQNAIGNIELNNITYDRTKKIVNEALTNIKKYNRGKIEKGKDVWETAVRSLINNTIFIIIYGKYKYKYKNIGIFDILDNLSEDKDYYNIYRTLMDKKTKDENDIINTIKEYYINNLNDIVEHITKSGNEPDEEEDLT